MYSRYVMNRSRSISNTWARLPRLVCAVLLLVNSDILTANYGVK